MQEHFRTVRIPSQELFRGPFQRFGGSSGTCQEPEVTDPASIKAAAARVGEQLGGSGLNLLINNAGIAKLNLLDTETLEDMTQVYTTNTVAPLLLGQAFLPLLKKAAEGSPGSALSCSKAAIVNMSSSAGSIEDVYLWHFGHVVSYRCSKAALNMLTKCQSLGYREHGILCVALHPGWVQTDMGGSGSQKGVRLLGIGTFYVLKDYTCTANNEVSIVRRPMFCMSKVVADECNLGYSEDDVPADVRVIPLRCEELSVCAQLPFTTVQCCVYETATSLFRAISKRQDTDFVFKAIGILSIRNREVTMRFFDDFLLAVDGSGKLPEALLSTPGTRHLVVSGRESPDFHLGPGGVFVLPQFDFTLAPKKEVLECPSVGPLTDTEDREEEEEKEEKKEEEEGDKQIETDGNPNCPGILEVIMDWPEGKDFGMLPEEEVTPHQEAPAYDKVPENEKPYTLFTDGSCRMVIHECETCAAIKQAKRVKPLWYGGQQLKPKPGEAWQIDYSILPQTRQGKRHVLTMVEATTGWLDTYPMPHATTRNTILGLEKQFLW
ncbi:C-factor-like [Grus japonensis]|uniref:C-factor-like n=1 Tax=Grus japonensis TaxID=30415 RepID=A0ABC9XFC1_GRUJA